MKHNFKLSEYNTDYQLTVHITNYIETYGKASLNDFKRVLSGQAVNHMRPTQIIEHYGVNEVMFYFKSVYGWEITKKKASA